MGAPQKYRTVALMWLYGAAVALACWVASHTRTESFATLGIDPVPAVLLFAVLPRPAAQWSVVLALSFGLELCFRPLFGAPIGTAIAEATQTSFHTLVTGWLIHQMRPLSFRRPNLSASVSFSGAVLVGALAGASVSQLVLWVFGTAPNLLAWQSSWFGNALGVATALPFMLAWQTLPRLRWSLPRAVEAAGLVLLWGVFFWLAAATESPTKHAEVLFLLVPTFVWTASRFGLRWGTLGNLIFTLVAPRIGFLHPDSTVWAVSQEAFLLMLVLSSLWLAVLLHDREQALRSSEASEARLWAVVTSIPDVVLHVDRNGRCVERIGSTAHQRISMDDEPTSIGSLLPQSATSQVRETIEAVLHDHTPRECRVRHEVRGEERWFEARVAPIQPQDNPSEPGTVMVSIRDITADRLSQRRAASIERPGPARSHRRRRP